MNNNDDAAMVQGQHTSHPRRDGGSSPTLPLQSWTVKQVTRKDVLPIIEKYHYSHHVPPVIRRYFGWYCGYDLYAVATYGIGVNSNLPGFLARTTGLPVENKNLVELTRLARIGTKDDKPAPLTKFLAVCHRLLFKEGYRYIVSFSDPDYNPYGGIYSAAGFTLLGFTNAEIDIIDKNGRKLNRRTLYDWRKKNGNPTIDDACNLLGYRKIKTPPKKRWFLALDKADKMRLQKQ